MKWLLAIWLIGAGVGISYNVILERKKQMELLNTMEQSLRQITYYMYQWRMPVEEVLKQIVKEKNQLVSFFEVILIKVEKKEDGDLGNVWQEVSRNFLEESKLPEEIKVLWSDCFFHMPMEPEAVRKVLELKSETVLEKKKELEAKYKGEQRLVLAMGVFASSFLCLILW